mgnify:CR=1 FL=1
MRRKARSVPASLTVYEPSNWNTPQTVTVTGVDDALDDGDVAYTIVTAAATSTDAIYNGINAADVAVTNTDNDASGITVTPTSGLTTTEARRHRRPSRWCSHPADRRRDDRPELERHDGRHGQPGEPDLHERELERARRRCTVTGVDDALDDGDVALQRS